MKAALAAGANAWNGGEIYGHDDYNSLHLLNAYFTQYPEDANKVVLSIKGGFNPGGLARPNNAPNGTPENVRRSIDACLKVLDGKKFLDLFECARLDPNVPIETTLEAMNEYVKAGKIGGVSLSEVNAATIRRAAKVVKVAAVEVEFSLWATDILTNDIASTCAELDIPIFAYSPIGRGFLVRCPMSHIKSTHLQPSRLAKLRSLKTSPKATSATSFHASKAPPSTRTSNSSAKWRRSRSARASQPARSVLHGSKPSAPGRACQSSSRSPARRRISE